jgi:hypothetical protein
MVVNGSVDDLGVVLDDVLLFRASDLGPMLHLSWARFQLEFQLELPVVARCLGCGEVVDTADSLAGVDPADGVQLVRLGVLLRLLQAHAEVGCIEGDRLQTRVRFPHEV